MYTKTYYGMAGTSWLGCRSTPHPLRLSCKREIGVDLFQDAEKRELVESEGKMRFENKRSVAKSSSFAVLTLLVAACGSSTPSASSASTSSAKATSTTASAAGQVSQAQAEIAKYMAMPTFVDPGPAIDVSKLKGKKVLVVLDAPAPSLQNIATAISQAGQAAGIQVQVFNGQGTLSTIEQGIQQGINQQVGAIILAGVATSQVPSSVAAANAAKIPIVDVVAGEPTPGVAGQGYGSSIFGGSGPSWVELGRLMADTAIVHSSGGSINVGVITFDNPISTGVVEGIKAVFSKCSNCHILSTQDIEPTNWATKVAGATSSLILANPNLNYVFPVSDTPSIFATAGVSQAGAAGHVAVVTSGSNGPATIALVQKGPIMIADPGSSAPWSGWEAMDQALRAMSGMKPGNPATPIRYLDKSNLAGLQLTSDLSSVFGDSYVAGYKKLWGLG